MLVRAAPPSPWAAGGAAGHDPRASGGTEAGAADAAVHGQAGVGAVLPAPLPVRCVGALAAMSFPRPGAACACAVANAAWRLVLTPRAASSVGPRRHPLSAHALASVLGCPPDSLLDRPQLLRLLIEVRQAACWRTAPRTEVLATTGAGWSPMFAPRLAASPRVGFRRAQTKLLVEAEGKRGQWRALARRWDARVKDGAPDSLPPSLSAQVRHL